MHIAIVVVATTTIAIDFTCMSLTASLISAHKHSWNGAEKRKIEGTTNWENPIDRQIHRLKIYSIHFFPKWSTARHLVSDNIPLPDLLRSHKQRKALLK